MTTLGIKIFDRTDTALQNIHLINGFMYWYRKKWELHNTCII